MLAVTGLLGAFAVRGQSVSGVAAAGADFSTRGLGLGSSPYPDQYLPSGGWPYPSTGSWPYPSGGWPYPSSGSCRCGAPCSLGPWGGSGICQANGQCLATFVPPICNGNDGDNKVCTMDAKVCPNGRSVGRIPPSCAFAPCDDGENTVCTLDAKVCPNGQTVGRVPPNCDFAPCNSGGTGNCRCGSVCFMNGGSLGVCQTNGECAQNILPPNCNGNNDRCGNCGDVCTRNGQSGYCGNNGVCQTGLIRPICNGGGNCPLVSCITLYCPESQQEMQYVNGCPTCPTCRGNSGGSGQRCFSDSWSVSAGVSASSLSSFGAGLYPWSQCPSGQTCVNGACRFCPLPSCYNPSPCIGGTMIPSTMDNGCPGCPRCSSESGSCTGPNCYLPCCSAYQVETRGYCRRCNF